MPTTLTARKTVLLGDLVAAVFDQAHAYGLTPPALAGNVATHVVAGMLLRAGNDRALVALKALRRSRHPARES